MKKSVILSAVVSAFAIAAASGQPVPFTAGSLVVHQTGVDGGATALTSAATRGFLKEITVGGTIVQTIDLPFLAAASGNRALNNSGSATSEGAMTLSADGRFLVVVGYNADAGTAGVVATAAATVNRVVGLIDCNGIIDSTTAFGDGYDANNIRSATSSNGTDIWTAGTATGTLGGIRYLVRAGTTSVAVTAPNLPTNTRYVNIAAGQLYTSSASGNFLGVSTVGTGLPTTAGQTITLLPGFPVPPVTPTPSTYDFWFADANTLYVADDRSIANGGGVQKWTLSAGTWSLAYTLNTGITVGTRALAGTVVAGTPVIYATTATANAAAGNALVTVTDTGAASAFSTIATSGANTWWTGVDFAPVCSNPGPTCYANCDASTTVPFLNVNDFTCFLNAFAAGASYANCDASTTAPVLNVNDFTCFLNAFAAGCSAP
ncbi:MAG: GC-type dockerin domain-anchored protein [Phycisphaerales bacterium]